MPEYARIFVVRDIAAVHRGFADVLLAATALERRSPGVATFTIRTVTRAYEQFNAELDAIAKLSATRSVQEIRQRIDATRQRRNTGRGGPNLRGAIRSRPLTREAGLATGAVGIAAIAPLEKLRNPLAPQYGSYWRAQEEGSSRNLGNRRGLFFGAGYGGGGTPADPGFAGGGGPHPLFATGGQLGQRGLPLARFRHPIPARHFIRDGANISRIAWERDVRALERLTVRRLASALR